MLDSPVQQFLFNHGVACLNISELAREECDRSILLHDHGSQLEVACISIDVVWQVGIGIAKQNVGSKQGFDLLEGTVTLFGPFEGFLLIGFPHDGSQGRKNVRSFVPEVMIEGDCTDEGVDLRRSFGDREVQERLNLLAPWLSSGESESMSKPVGLLHAPFTLERVDSEAVVLQQLQNHAERSQMVLPIFTEDANIIHEALKFLDATEFHLHVSCAKSGEHLTPIGSQQ
jgi:hypothetical protein